MEVVGAGRGAAEKEPSDFARCSASEEPHRTDSEAEQGTDRLTQGGSGRRRRPYVETLHDSLQ